MIKETVNFEDKIVNKNPFIRTKSHIMSMLVSMLVKILVSKKRIFWKKG